MLHFPFVTGAAVYRADIVYAFVTMIYVGELVIFLEQRIYFFAVLRKSFLVLLVSDYLGNSVEELKVGF